MNTAEFAIRDGIPNAIDFTNPAPDADLHSVNFKPALADRISSSALCKRYLNGEAAPHRDLRWFEHVNAKESKGTKESKESKVAVSSKKVIAMPNLSTEAVSAYHELLQGTPGAIERTEDDFGGRRCVSSLADA